MGIISRTFNKFFNKTEELIEPETRELAIVNPESQTKIPEFTMPQGEKLSVEEQIEENKYMIRQLDPKLVFITDMINELNSEEDALQVIAEEPDMMRLWLAHVVYKENINNFYTLISGKNINLLNPEALVPKSKRLPPKPRKIKCLKDLPLQKSLLN
jgi:hypothetical protein